MDENNGHLIPEADRDYLQEREFIYKIVHHEGSLLLIIQEFPISELYSPKTADLLILIPAGYPNAALDMFWTYPDVKLNNGNWPSAADHHQTFAGRNWQRWSRHGAWRAGVDNLRTFLSSIRKEIERGV